MMVPRVRPYLLAFCATAVLLPWLWGCSDDGPGFEPAPREDLRTKYGLEPFRYDQIPYPAGNGPDDAGYAERVELGRLLFFDHLLSGDHDVSCGTCHHPALAWADARPLGAGVSGVGLGPDRVLTDRTVLDMPRNVPTNLNSGLSSAVPGGPPHEDGIMFWDGRATGLELQSMQPTATFDEMRHYAYSDTAAADSVVLRVRAIPEYVERFRAAFPEYADDMDANPGDPDHHVIRVGSMEMALASYQRELVTLTSPYDDYLAGDDSALSDAAFRGLDLFFGKALCGDCHAGPMLSTYVMARTGVKHDSPGRYPAERGGNGDDLGMNEHTRDPQDLYKYRTPGLRNVELTGPWFRHGVATSLRQVVEFFNIGARYSDPTVGPQNRAEEIIDPRIEPYADELLHPSVRPLGLTEQEIDDIVEFLKALTDRDIDSPYIDPTVPERVPSGIEPVERLAPFSLVPLPEHAGD